MSHDRHPQPDMQFVKRMCSKKKDSTSVKETTSGLFQTVLESDAETVEKEFCRVISKPDFLKMKVC